MTGFVHSHYGKPPPSALARAVGLMPIHCPSCHCPVYSEDGGEGFTFCKGCGYAECAACGGELVSAITGVPNAQPPIRLNDN